MLYVESRKVEKTDKHECVCAWSERESEWAMKIWEKMGELDMFRIVWT